MMNRIFLFSLIIYKFASIECDKHVDIQETKLNSKLDVGKPLFITPFIKENKTSEAKEAAKVTGNFCHNLTSYSGFITVNERCDSKLFFWFFPSENNYKTAPVILWLQGGPGGSDLVGLFQENGPYIIKEDNIVELREHRWTKNFSILYIDNPVGTGYSFTDSHNGYPMDETQIGEELYEALQQFFLLFSEYQGNEFYIAGKSYGCKHVAAIGYQIYEKNPQAKIKINLQGLTIGNGFCDPENQLDFGKYMYQFGLTDSFGKLEVDAITNLTISQIQNQNYALAFDINRKLTDNGLLKKLTGYDYLQNLLFPNVPVQFLKEAKLVMHFVQSPGVRLGIHVGNLSYNYTSSIIEKKLYNDVMQSVAPWMAQLINNYRVMFYNGQFDLTVPYIATKTVIKHLNFNGKEQYLKHNRKIWYVDNEIAGYVKTDGHLTELIVRNAGHNVIIDQPKWGLDLMKQFIQNAFN